MNGPKVVVTKSTVPVGTAEQGARGDRAAHADVPFTICSNPEFLKEGAAIDDFMKPDRVVVGVDDDRAREVMARAVRAVRAHRQPDPLHGHPVGRGHEVRGQRHAGHAHLVHEPGRRISASGSGADVTSVRRGIGTDQRIGPAFLFPGPATAAPASRRTSRR